jgi:hypothetical protein
VSENTASPHHLGANSVFLYIRLPLSFGGLSSLGTSPQRVKEYMILVDSPKTVYMRNSK